MATEENNLVRQLTSRLEQVSTFPSADLSRSSERCHHQTSDRPSTQLQREKDQLERAVEGQGDAIALKLRLALLAYEQQKPQVPPPEQRPHRSSKSRTNSSSSSLSTSASTSSSVSFPSSPSSSSASALVSPILPAPDLTPDVLLALRENETLRVRLANSERVNAYYQRELAELRRRCGISIDELEELDLSSPFAAGPSGSYPRQRSVSRTSRLDMYGGPSSSSIRIPGAAASVSPPGGGGGGGGGGTGRRSLTSSFMFSPDGARSARFASESYTSSINTTATTPSSSYPNPRPPAATPATLAAFSPASANANPNGTLALGLGGAPGLGFGSHFTANGFAAGPAAAGSSPQQLYHPQGFAERRNSLNGLVAAHFSNSLLQSSSDASGGTGTGAGTGIDVDDLVSIGGSAGADEVNSTDDSTHLEVVGDGQTTAVPPTTTGSAEQGRDTAASSFPNPSSQLVPFPTAASTAPSLNGTAGIQAPAAAPAAVGAGTGGGGGGELSVDPLVAAITRSLAKLVAEGSATLVDEASSSSSDGGDGNEEVHPPTATGEEGEETDGDDGAETPLSSGASRTGSMRRRYFS